MKLKRWLVAGLLCATAMAWDAPRGTVPRSAPDQYSVHGEIQGVGVGARLLTPGQARKALGADVDQCCMVVEVAVYPQKDRVTEVSVSDFTLRITGQDIAGTAASPEVVAGKLQTSNERHQPTVSDVAVTQYDTVGHRSGTDPNTGQRGSTTYATTGATVSLGVGGSPEAQLPNNADRKTIERKLSDKALPPGSTTTPVSGYLYFTFPQKKNVKYRLEYVLNSNKVVLALP